MGGSRGGLLMFFGAVIGAVSHSSMRPRSGLLVVICCANNSLFWLRCVQFLLGLEVDELRIVMIVFGYILFVLASITQDTKVHLQ